MQDVISKFGATEWICVAVVLTFWAAYFVAIVRSAPFPMALLSTILLPITIPMFLVGSLAILVAIPIMVIPQIPSMLRDRRRYAKLVAEGRALGRKATEAKLREKEGTFLIVRYAVGFPEVRWTSDVLAGMTLELLQEADQNRILNSPEAIAENQVRLVKYLESKSNQAVLLQADFMQLVFGKDASALRLVMLFSPGASEFF